MRRTVIQARCLSHRWIIKYALFAGLIIALISGVAVWIQSVLVLFGPSDLRFELMTLEWPEEKGSGVEGYKRLDLEDENPLESMKA